MAGHNKWSKIKHRKAVVDKRRGKAWSMCSRAIISAARQGGADPTFNFALRQAMDEARYYNVPSDNIERAIKKGAGGGEGDNFEYARYEGYGPGGVAVVVEALTDNRTRTAANVRNIFADNAGKLGTTGSVAHQFDHKGRVVLAAGPAEADRVLAAALDAGADDCRPTDDEPPAWEVLCAPADLASVRQHLQTAGFTISQSGFDMLPTTLVPVTGEPAKQLLALIDEMEDDEDVKKVYSNADIADSELARLAGE